MNKDACRYIPCRRIRNPCRLHSVTIPWRPVLHICNSTHHTCVHPRILSSKGRSTCHAPVLFWYHRLHVPKHTSSCKEHLNKLSRVTRWPCFENDLRIQTTYEIKEDRDISVAFPAKLQVQRLRRDVNKRLRPVPNAPERAWPTLKTFRFLHLHY